MRHITKLAGVIMCIVAAGCGTLEPGGAHEGNKVLYDADLTITTSWQVIDSVLLWEKENREALAGVPEIKEACDVIRSEAPSAFKHAVAMRDAYAAGGSELDLDAALTVLRGIATQAALILKEQGL